MTNGTSSVLELYKSISDESWKRLSDMKAVAMNLEADYG